LVQNGFRCKGKQNHHHKRNSDITTPDEEYTKEGKFSEDGVLQDDFLVF
jgi:hypothetical protein